MNGDDETGYWIPWPKKEPPYLGQTLDVGELGKARIIEARENIALLRDDQGEVVRSAHSEMRIKIRFLQNNLTWLPLVQ